MVLLIKSLQQDIRDLKKEVNELNDIVTKNEGRRSANSKWLYGLLALLSSGFLVQLYDAILDLMKYHF